MSGIKDKVTGNVKEGVGKATGDDKLKNEGKLDQFTGSVKDKTDDVVDGVRDAAKDAGDKVDSDRDDRR